MKKFGARVCMGLLLTAVCLSGCKGKEKDPEVTDPVLTPGVEQPGITPGAGSEILPGGEGAEAEMFQKLVRGGKLSPLEKRIPTNGNVYVAADVTGIYSESACLATTDASVITGELFSEGLFAYGADGSVQPNIAKSYEVNSNATVFTIHLREGMRWSDGTPFTADDCLFYYNSLCVPKVTGESIPACFLVGTQRATFAKQDLYTFTVTFPTGKSSFLKELIDQGGICFAPEHFYANMLPEYMGEKAALSKAKDMGYTSVTEMLRGTLLRPWNALGLPTLNPYILSTEEGKSDISGAYYEFVRNPYYWKVDAAGRQLPYLDRIEFTRVSGEAQQLLLTTEGYLAVSRLTSGQIAEATSMAEHGNYRIVSWGSDVYAVSNSLKNFPEQSPAEKNSRGIGASHAEYWYIK